MARIATVCPPCDVGEHATAADDGICTCCGRPDEAGPVHVGHFSRLGGTWWCDTCDSPYCEEA